MHKSAQPIGHESARGAKHESAQPIGVGATILPHRTPRPHRSRPAPWQAERDEHGCGHEVGSDAFTCLGTPALPIGLPHPASAQRSGRPPQTRRGVNLARSAVETRSGNCPAAQIANAPFHARRRTWCCQTRRPRPAAGRMNGCRYGFRMVRAAASAADHTAMVGWCARWR
jgi:hypothetical protein